MLRLCYIKYEVKKMAKTATLNLRIDPNLKAGVEKLYNSFGMTISDAVTIFLHKSLMEGGLPFDVRNTHYNMETEQAIQEAKDIMSGKKKTKKYKSVDEAFAMVAESED